MEQKLFLLTILGVGLFLTFSLAKAADVTYLIKTTNKPDSTVTASNAGTVTITWTVTPTPPKNYDVIIFSASTGANKGGPYTQPFPAAHITAKTGEQYVVQLRDPSVSPPKEIAVTTLTVGGGDDASDPGSNSSGGNAQSGPSIATQHNCQQTGSGGYQFCDTLFGKKVTAAEYLSNLYTWAIGIAIFSASIMIIYAGYKYTTSQGNPSAIGEAKEIILSALLGLLLLLLSYTILHFLGINVQNTLTNGGGNQTNQQGTNGTNPNGSSQQNP